MTRSIIIMVLLALLTPTTLMAQKRKAVRKSTPKVAVRKSTPKVAVKKNTPKAKISVQPEAVEDPKFVTMLESTARLVVIDSIVTDSASFLHAINVNSEEGQLSYGKDAQSIVYTDQLGNRRILADRNAKGQLRLYQSDKLGETWSAPEELKGLNDNKEFTDIGFPYLLPDGVTLYFAARGANGLGGYDIYRSRFDTEKGRFLHPENMGLPYNSDADDYMLTIDEQNQLGYFATSRRQPKGKVCVYIFIPSKERNILNNQSYSPEKLRSLARLEKISNTWGNGNARKQAMERLHKVQNSAGARNNEKQADFSIVINDQKTYTRFSDFRHAESKEHMKALLQKQEQLNTLQASLQKSRDYYAKGTPDERTLLRSEILNAEQQQEELREAIHQLEKLIRNAENQ